MEYISGSIESGSTESELACPEEWQLMNKIYKTISQEVIGLEKIRI